MHRLPPVFWRQTCHTPSSCAHEDIHRLNRPLSGSARRDRCIAALAALLAPLLVFLCVMLMGELAMLPLPAWAKASRSGISRYHIVRDVIAFVLPCTLLGLALGRWLRQGAVWSALLLGVLALGFMVAIPWRSWGDSWALTSWLLTTRIGLMPAAGAQPERLAGPALASAHPAAA